MEEESLMQAIDLAIQAAHEAGALIRAGFRQPQQIRMKTPTEIVTQVDQEAEQIIVRTIQQAFPDHDFLGEEGHVPRQNAEHVWVIDPLDGTRSYALGIPFFCVSIALTVRGRVELGVIYDPLGEETFHARLGGGTHLNGVRVRPAQQTCLDEAVVYVGIAPARSRNNPELAMPVLERLGPSIAAIRNLGSAALGIAYVACGRLDISYHDRLSPWDMCAGALLVQEAGGVATDFSGEPISLSSNSIIAAGNPNSHQVVLEIAQEVSRMRSVASDHRTTGATQPGHD
jgi:myo-inositol-1(or 4)-monophosphatase